MALGVAVLLLASFGYQSRMRDVEQAVAHVNAADRETIRSGGCAESRLIIEYGLAVAALPLLMGSCLLGLGLARTRSLRVPQV